MNGNGRERYIFALYPIKYTAYRNEAGTGTPII